MRRTPSRTGRTCLLVPRSSSDQLGADAGRTWTHDRWMVIDPESTLTLEEIVERFRKLFNREMTVEERRIFFLPGETE